MDKVKVANVGGRVGVKGNIGYVSKTVSTPFCCKCTFHCSTFQPFKAVYVLFSGKLQNQKIFDCLKMFKVITSKTASLPFMAKYTYVRITFFF